MRREPRSRLSWIKAMSEWLRPLHNYATMSARRSGHSRQPESPGSLIIGRYLPQWELPAHSMHVCAAIRSKIEVLQEHAVQTHEAGKSSGDATGAVKLSVRRVTAVAPT